MALSVSASAQEWPSEPIKMIVPFSAGGGSDPVARLLAEGLSERLGQPVLVEFQPGASATIGANMVAQAEPDGYTILLTSNTPVVNVEYTIPDLPYDMEDLVPIAEVTGSTVMIVANSNFEPNTFAEMVDYAKENPGKINLAIQGVGGLSHFAAALIEYRAGAEFNLVPYKGAGDLQADLLSGVVDMGIGFPTAFISGVEPGRLKFIGSLADERLETLPDVQTTEEQGFPQIKASAWLMLFGPKGLPQDVIDEIVVATNDFLETDEAKKSLGELGYTVPVESGPEKAAALLDRDRQDFKEIFESGAMDLN